MEGLFNALGGCAALLFNLGKPNEVGILLFRFQRLQDVRLDVGRGLAQAAVAGPRGGKVLFNDNQVVLDLADAPTVSVLSSAFVGSADDVSVASNHLIVEQQGDKVFANLVALAQSVRVSDNRLEEPLFLNNKPVTDVLSAFCSAPVIGTVTGNQASHCLSVFFNTPRRIFSNNFERIQLFTNPRFCELLH